LKTKTNKGFISRKFFYVLKILLVGITEYRSSLENSCANLVHLLVLTDVSLIILPCLKIAFLKSLNMLQYNISRTVY
jgi:hypothetical protein